MATTQTTISPHNQQPLITRTYPSNEQIDAAINDASAAQKLWSRIPLDERIAIGRKFMDEIKNMSNDIPMELTLEMGRPVSQNAGEIRGLLQRADYMLSVASSCLADISLKDTDQPGFRRFIKRTPLGVVLIITPWNYPYLTSINSVLPAIVAGNAVLLKPSPQTPLTAERFALALTRAGVPPNVIQVVHMSPELTSYAVQHSDINFVSFTGSVQGGKAVARAAANGDGFPGVTLELGGKDPAYVRADADLNYTVPELVDGAFYNAGQSCCAVERIYVHEAAYDDFIAKYVDAVKKYQLGDPTLPETNLGPVVSLASAARIRKQVADAVEAGATPLIPEDIFPIARLGSTYVAPQVLVNVNHDMTIMVEETFGPVVGIQKVSEMSPNMS
ncbi:NAD-aldehyde dehydrogenase [Amanita muscaria]